MNRGELARRLAGWRHEGWISALDARFGLFVADGSGDADLGLLAALTSLARGQGHACLDPVLAPALPGLDFAAAWAAGTAVATPWLARGEGGWAPLVLDGGRLYLGRLHRAECVVAAALRRRAETPPAAAPDPRLVEALFPAGPGAAAQRLAAVLACLKPLAIITGGPGTGKTTTVVRMLALRLAAAPGLAVQLLAPTGKAAARLTGAIRAARATLPVAEGVRRAIPERVVTVHRFLGLHGGRARFHRHHPAPVDLVVLDEASMIDLPTMYRLLEALPEAAALILLGDPDQLASVEAGSVLADLVAPARPQAFTAPVRTALHSAGAASPVPPADARPWDDVLVRLQHSHRFSDERGIGRLARGVRDGETGWAELVELAAGHAELDCIEWREGAPFPRAALDDLLDALDPLSYPDAAAALAGLEVARVLCALREGPAGVGGLNALVCERLGRPAGSHRPGRPLLITRNHHALGLYNGDMGVLWQEDGRLRAFFPAGEGGMHALPVAELPAHETAYALTVHKSQGSEYDRLLLVLPPRPHPLVTRELIYTALTRARRAVRIVAAPESWDAGVRQRTRRASGLAGRLAAG